MKQILKKMHVRSNSLEQEVAISIGRLVTDHPKPADVASAMTSFKTFKAIQTYVSSKQFKESLENLGDLITRAAVKLEFTRSPIYHCPKCAMELILSASSILVQAQLGELKCGSCKFVWRLDEDFKKIRESKTRWKVNPE